ELPTIVDMTATHHSYGRNKPLPIAQILNDDRSFFSLGQSDNYIISIRGYNCMLEIFWIILDRFTDSKLKFKKIMYSCGI
ncbi:MAG: hypothetical protein WBE61_09370, partial [Nitrososphaeraceae archaeon]